MATVSNPGLRSLQFGVGVLLGVGALVLFLFDPTRFHFYPLCVFHQATGLLCPGCGGLRAVHQLLHGHFYAAFRFNPLVVTTLPLLAVWLVGLATRNPTHQSGAISRRVAWCWVVPFLVISLLFAIWRNIPGSLLASFPG